MDRGIPTEAVLAEMRASDPPVQYLVGTPKGRLSRLEKDLLGKPWQQAREGVQVKLLAADSELYVFAESVDRVNKERAMRKRQMKWLWKRLRELAAMEISREEMLMKLGAARSRAPTAWRLVEIDMDKEGLGEAKEGVGPCYKKSSLHQVAWATAAVVILGGGWGGNWSLRRWIKSWSSGSGWV
jgi:hypothetical protein